jgi:phosphoglycolate phosphatase
MQYDLVIFDLDGTLLDTLDDLKNAVNAALALRGAPARTREQVRAAIGDGLRMLLTRSLPARAPDAEISETIADFKAFYDSHIDVETTPYPGIVGLLVALTDAGVKICVNSNKYDAAVKALCESHFYGFYERAFGESAETPKKPSPAAAARIMKEVGVTPRRTLYVGDSAVDLETAKNAGIAAAWVSWGFRTRDEIGDLGGIPAFDTAGALQAYILLNPGRNP